MWAAGEGTGSKLLDNMFLEWISMGGVSCLKGVGGRKHLQHLFQSACGVTALWRGEGTGERSGACTELYSNMGSDGANVGGLPCELPQTSLTS